MVWTQWGWDSQELLPCVVLVGMGQGNLPGEVRCGLSTWALCGWLTNWQGQLGVSGPQLMQSFIRFSRSL